MDNIENDAFFEIIIIIMHLNTGRQPIIESLAKRKYTRSSSFLTNKIASISDAFWCTSTYYATEMQKRKVKREIKRKQIGTDRSDDRVSEN